MSRHLGKLAAALLCAASTAAAQPVANSVSDFSGVQGDKGWFYGYWDRTTDANGAYSPSEFTLMQNYSGGAWSAEPGTFWTLLRSTGAHPNGTTTSGGRTPDEQWAIRRYVPTVSADLSVSGLFGKESYGMGGDGATALILVGGNVLYSSTIGGMTAPTAYAVNLGYVAAGTPIDIILTPGPNADDRYDSSRLTAAITATGVTTTTPEPATLASLAGGVTVLGAFARRRRQA